MAASAAALAVLRRLVLARLLLLPALRVLLLRVAMGSAGCHQLLPASACLSGSGGGAGFW